MWRFLFLRYSSWKLFDGVSIDGFDAVAGLSELREETVFSTEKDGVERDEGVSVVEVRLQSFDPYLVSLRIDLIVREGECALVVRPFDEIRHVG